MPIVHFDTKCMCFVGFHVVPREIPQGFSFLLFLVMTGAVAARLGYSNPPGLDKLRSRPARVAASSLREVEESNRGSLLIGPAAFSMIRILQEIFHLFQTPAIFFPLRKIIVNVESLISRKICNLCLMAQLYKITLCFMKVCRGQGDMPVCMCVYIFISCDDYWRVLHKSYDVIMIYLLG